MKSKDKESKKGSKLKKNKNKYLTKKIKMESNEK
jgi:hypothetical protein